jgi:hypothetical protein
MKKFFYSAAAVADRFSTTTNMKYRARAVSLNDSTTGAT